MWLDLTRQSLLTFARARISIRARAIIQNNMCTHLVKIYNKSHYHNPKGYRLYMTVPCGKCPECIAQKRAEWTLRSTVEYEHCVRNGGYVFFDTLTYNNDYIPRFRDHACFQRKHIQDFLKRVRKRIAKNDGILERAFRYFYVSEYGHNYKRPHYHILFFVSDPNLPYTKLKKYIRQEWKYGFTDLTSVKFPYRGVVHSLFCCQYVAKYVTKPDDYVDSLYDNLRFDISKDDFRKHFYPFHQQSTGFGESLLFDSKNLQNFKQMFCVCNKRKYTLPMYYIRRLYYKQHINDDGSISWIANDLGCQLIPQYKYSLYETYSENLRSFIDAIPQFLSVPDVYQKVAAYTNRNATYCGKDVLFNRGDYEYLCRYFRGLDSDFISRFAFWKRFRQGFIILDDSFNPLTTDCLCPDQKVHLDFFETDKVLLSLQLDLQTVPEFIEFDKLLMVVKRAVGDLDKNTNKLKEKTKRLFTYLNYAN